MRTPALLLALLLLAGCSGSGDDSTTAATDTTSDGTTSPGTTTTRTTTPATPNEYPRIVLNITSNGTPTNTTVVGGNLTFDASGSYDPDGNGISAIAMALTDSNGTMPARLLYSSGTATPQTFRMENPGPVNVTVSAVDRRNGLTTLRTHVYVDQQVTLGADADFTGALPSQVAEAESCEGATGVPQLDATTWAARPFPVHNGTTYVTATFLEGTGEIALCAPDGTAISAAATSGSVESTPGTVFTVPTGTANYFVSVYSGAANQSVVVQVTVHSAPRAA